MSPPRRRASPACRAHHKGVVLEFRDALRRGQLQDATSSFSDLSVFLCDQFASALSPAEYAVVRPSPRHSRRPPRQSGASKM
eukprot:CAMPEP_0204275154 /NCGR_PEP_ID=MMETSP0468-20130131/25593_1 /ASSEMBLY_ACC=CAM_ASM_000383 /TAXON_ID=2969 /ORGANISM="Oxyrrhis marina" /LENGTH=81 /DNA_ID=CAMNT_0051251449 /DNA_START=160 /DNA_END=405 /DNA_ORIENTATION=+